MALCLDSFAKGQVDSATMNERILSKINVVDMTEGVAGPYAAVLPAEMGANVIKVERPAGDWSRPTDHFRVDDPLSADPPAKDLLFDGGP